jgi:hypothetical protein
MVKRQSRAKRAARPKPKPQPAPAPAEKHRPGKAELEQRINTVVTLIATGNRHEEICRFAASQWGVNYRQTDRYIQSANALILAEAAKDRTTRIAESIATLVAVKKRAYAIDDLTNMRAAVAEISKLFGDYPAARMKVETWEDEVILLLRSGKVSQADVYAEFGDTDKARRLVVAAGLLPDESRAAQGEGKDLDASLADAAPGAGQIH